MRSRDPRGAVWRLPHRLVGGRVAHVTEVERVCHKVEFCGNIINNDRVRAKLEIKNIVADLKDLIRAYSKS